MSEGMYTKLMQLSKEESERPPIPKPSPAPEVAPQPSKALAAVAAARKRSAELPPALEDLTESGYTSHSYRFTQAEVRWLQRFCLDLAIEFDLSVSHNLLIRMLLRLAYSEWTKDPAHNPLRSLIETLPRK